MSGAEPVAAAAEQTPRRAAVPVLDAGAAILAGKTAKWAPAIENVGKGGNPQPRPPNPEYCKIGSRSQSGRVFRHQHCWRPRATRPPSPKPPPPPKHLQDEQLLYMALYRDKVAQHQAVEAERAERVERVERAVRRVEKAGGSASASQWLDGGANSPEAPGRRAVGHESGSHAGSEDGVGAEGGVSGSAAAAEVHHASTSVGPAAAEQLPAHVGAASSSGRTGAIHGSGGGAPHIAAVSAAGAHGAGVTSEYLMDASLGRLFELWRARQEEEGREVEPEGPGPGRDTYSSRALPAAPREQGRKVASQARSTAAGLQSVPSSPPSTPRDAARVNGRPVAAAGEPSSTSSATGGDGGGGSREASHLPHGAAHGASHSARGAEGNGREAERRRMQRVFTVVTNPKVRCQSLSERSGGDNSSRPAPHTVEVFPALNLMRLYKGPWRLDI